MWLRLSFPSANGIKNSSCNINLGSFKPIKLQPLTTTAFGLPSSSRSPSSLLRLELCPALWSTWKEMSPCLFLHSFLILKAISNTDLRSYLNHDTPTHLTSSTDTIHSLQRLFQLPLFLNLLGHHCPSLSVGDLNFTFVICSFVFDDSPFDRCEVIPHWGFDLHLIHK